MIAIGGALLAIIIILVFYYYGMILLNALWNSKIMRKVNKEMEESLIRLEKLSRDIEEWRDIYEASKSNLP